MNPSDSSSDNNATRVWDVIVIGSGPAGLTAAIYTTRGAASTLVLAGEKWGGQLMLTTTVENYPGFVDGIQGPELMSAMRSQAQRLGATIIDKSAQSVKQTDQGFEVVADGTTYQAKTVLVATGAITRWLGVPGEEKLIGRGVSSCAPCDAPFFKDKHVAVIGGGDSAMEEALVLVKYAQSVTVIHRRDAFRASAVMQHKVLNNPKIKIIWNSEVAEVVGDQKVTGLKLINVVEGTTSDLAIDGVFVAVGHNPESAMFKDVIELDEKGFVKKMQTDDYQMLTSIPGVFVAGDVHDIHYKQAVTAAGFGCMAALEILKYLEQSG